MIKQQIFRKSLEGCRTAAVSSALRESAWLPLLEQQSALHYGVDFSVPVYYQYPFGTGFVVSRCGVDPNSRYGSSIAHQLIVDDNDDLAPLNSARPLSDSLFSTAYVQRGSDPDPLPTLEADALSDVSLLTTGFRLIDSFFDEPLLAAMFEALFWAAQDKQQMIHILLDGEPASVSRQGRLMMEMLMRCLPVREVTRLSWCTLLSPNDSALSYSVFISPLAIRRESAFSNLEKRCIRFDLTKRAVSWPDIPPTVTERSVLLARALLAHDLHWVDRVREETVTAPRASQRLRLELPPFERGMSLTQYVNDWADTLEIRQGVLNEDAFFTLAQEEWPRLIDRIITAADLMPTEDFTAQLLDCLVSLSRGRGAVLGMTEQHLRDLSALLLDSLDWDSLDLSDPAVARSTRMITEYADQFTDDDPCQRGSLTACRVVHALLSSPAAQLYDIIQHMAVLNDDYPPLFATVQACARRYVADRCRAAKKDAEEFALADELLTAMSIVGYVRFSGGIPDLRPLDKIRDTIASIGGSAEARRYSAQLDKLRKRMSASRSVNQAQRRELKLMLLISLLLTLVIVSVILVYFLFLK